MSDSLRNLFHSKKVHRETSEKVNVLVSLNVSANDEATSQLKSLGLDVTQCEGNKLIGAIETQNLARLAAHPSVQHVEQSVALKPTGKPSAKLP